MSDEDNHKYTRFLLYLHVVKDMCITNYMIFRLFSQADIISTIKDIYPSLEVSLAVITVADTVTQVRTDIPSQIEKLYQTYCHEYVVRLLCMYTISEISRFL